MRWPPNRSKPALTIKTYMTSWIRVAPKKKVDEAVRPFLFKTGAAEFCDEFNQYLYTTLYTQSVRRPLTIYDQVNPVSPNFAIIKETFCEVPGTSFVDSMIPNVTTLNAHDGNRVIPYVNSIPREDLQTSAASILEWSPSMLKEISAIRTQNNLPDLFDVGVHMVQPLNSRSRDNVAVVSAYIDAVREVDTRLGNPSVLRVFVGAEQSILLQEFMQQAKPSWKIYTITQLNVNGFSVVTFDRQQPRVRLQAYKEFIATLSCLQTSENLITSLSNETGKFLFMTNTTMTYFRSMEATAFVAR
jgi:hypothetical protein